MARRLPTIILTIEPIPCVFVRNESLLPCRELVVTTVEALVVVDPCFVDVEGGMFVRVLLEDTPLSLPSDEVPCGEDDALDKKGISANRSGRP